MPPKTVPPHYECLGVDPSISDADLSRHYKKLSLQLHPDRAAYRNDAVNEVHVQARYQRITEAYAVLSDPARRCAYDTKHAVNFQSRLVRLQAMIGQHNTSALRPSSTTAEAAEGEGETGRAGSASHGNASQHGQATPTTKDPTANGPAEGSDEKQGEYNEDDDEDDYVPAPIVPSRTRGNRTSSSTGRGDDGETRPGEEDTDEDEWGNRVRNVFHLLPRAASSGAGLTEDGVPITQYRGVTLMRRRSVGTSDQLAHTHDTDSQWGLVLDGNVLLGLQDGTPEETRSETIAGLAEVVFPSAVQQVNDTMVQARTNVTQLLSSRSPQGSTIVPAVVDLTSALTTTTDEPAATEQVQMVLAFCTESFDLVGDTHLLRDDTILRDLVPDWCVAAEMPALMPGVRVVSVNQALVDSAEDLRRALRNATDALSSPILPSSKNTAGDVVAAAKRPRTTRSIVVECCALPFI
ncbi:hypothetical protein ABB37_01691 [Leptomonas pyrrhocoris]|uniref:J domain-containing protein n=1 Tax=Leptomonas pyrrhocoris TaxID=157538 RepID=A0A0N0DZJ7_LEPPY|nr:hypothetical protein ABB37_01691 [Leptomonas pyrrhocoris]KPA85375.1 hypothetical protein ABB37_01691 [Leptomonas pyrrhocoris]|eukprot:XP_015663814.1 hypothetical protein ABB37_01691 [Leptomonas pyrrhocoris]